MLGEEDRGEAGGPHFCLRVRRLLKDRRHPLPGVWVLLELRQDLLRHLLLL